MFPSLPAGSAHLGCCCLIMAILFNHISISPLPPGGGGFVQRPNKLNVSVLSQNVNSLNLSSYNVNKSKSDFHLKLNAVLKNRPMICVLQDTRCGPHSAFLEKELNITKFGRYKAYLNSSKAERGVITLFSEKLDFTIFNIYNSLCENAMIIDLSIEKFRFLLINTYGPVQTKDGNFFKSLREKIQSLNISYYLLMGDLNAVSCIDNIHGSQGDMSSNIDIINMAQIPNLKHSKELNFWIQSSFAYDRFRALYPEKIEFSYVPFNKTAKNRSRIDSIYCSPNFCSNIKKVEYLPLLSKTFDHKPIYFSIGKLRNNNSKSIDNTLLDLDFLYDTVKFACIELALDNHHFENKDELKSKLAEISSLSKQLQCLEINIKNYPNDQLLNIIKSDYEQKIEVLCNNFPSYDSLLDAECIVEPDIYLQAVLNEILNSGVAFQSYYIKQQNLEKDKILLDLHSRYASNDFTSLGTINLERDLGVIVDKENSRLLESSEYYKLLNFEKPSKLWGELLKNKNKGESLEIIRNYDGSEFNSKKERNEHIKQHYSNIFSIPYFSNTSIEDFFAEDLNHPMIENHKLSFSDKELLESPICIEEIEKALDSSNFNSAPGLDGISMKTLKKFWPLVRIPIFNAFKLFCRKGHLTGIHKTSKIKLIQKTGNKDFTQIGNWRPISVLSSIAKLFSGVVSLRLDKVIDKVSPIQQKAYSKQFNIIECLITIYENIQKAISSKTPLGILILDFSKAFDSISHYFIRRCFKFFNFGENFINLVMTCLSKREACIVTESGGFTENFPILSSVLQGDRPSPNFFKVCLAPLIIKIMINVRISFPIELSLSNSIDSAPSPKCSAFADDFTGFYRPDPDNMISFHNILENFGEISNLRVNKEKTKVMVCGGEASPNFVATVRELGYDMTDTGCILGIHFDKSMENFNSNWDRILEKIIKIKNFWSLFNLSIPGKIMICKTYLFSQLSYLGSMTRPPDLFIEKLDKLIYDFLRQEVIVAKNRLTEPIEKGGLGIFKTKEFLSSLKEGMFKRGINSNDTWGLELKSFFDIPGDFLSIDINKINPNLNPILFTLTEAFLQFKNAFFNFEGNCVNDRLLNNLRFENSQNNVLTMNIFTNHTWFNYKTSLKKLKLSDCLENSSKFLNYNDFRVKNDCNLNIMEYNRLTEHLSFILLPDYQNTLSLPSQKIENIFSRKKVKAKTFRRYLSISDFSIEHFTPAKTRYKWTNTPFDDLREKSWVINWKFSFITINIREFIFKFLNNRLAFNANLSHYQNSTTPPDCTFCSLTNLRPVCKETYRHFFIGCPTTIKLFDLYFNGFLERKIEYKNINLLLLGAPANLDSAPKLILNIELLLFNFFIFREKLSRKIPLLINLNNFFEWYRVFFLKSFYYRRSWDDWKK